MTGPKQGVYSIRRAQCAHRNASTQPLLTIGYTNPSSGRGRFYRLGGLNFGRYSQCLLAGGTRRAALRQWISLLLSILRAHFAVYQATKPATSASLPFLCAFFCAARAQKCLDSCSRVETVKETQKMGASRGDNPVVTGLANYERAVCRVARLGGLPSGISRFIAPQRRRWTTPFSTSPAGAARFCTQTPCRR
jgi:hypothetical protein